MIIYPILYHPWSFCQKILIFRGDLTLCRFEILTVVFLAPPCLTSNKELARKGKVEEVISGCRRRPESSLPRCAVWRPRWPGRAAGWRRCTASGQTSRCWSSWGGRYRTLKCRWIWRGYRGSWSWRRGSTGRWRKHLNLNIFSFLSSVTQAKTFFTWNSQNKLEYT